MNYQETLNWMFSQLPMYQRQGKIAFKKDLINSLALSKHLNYPEKQFKCIHVAGTNGKGSTSHMIASILQEAGFKVGLYTSPHLKDFRERVRINGSVISENDVVNFVKDNESFLKHQGLSFFEMTVGLAFDVFAKKKVDFAVVEVGLGGRLDSTNIINPEVSVITNIGFDHMQFLGNTLPEIAFEKAGIIKETVPVVIGEYQEEVFEVFQTKAIEMDTNIVIASQNINIDFESDLKGSYQKKNIKTAVQTISILKQKGYSIAQENIKNGLLNVVKNTGLLGRWQVLQLHPKIICDTGHNKEGLHYIFQQIAAEKFEKLHIVLGVVNDKDLASILPKFPKNAKYYFCKPNIPRGLDAQELNKVASQFDLKGEAFKNVQKALNAAKDSASKKDLIFVGGSTFVVAEVV
jgi:dihydrofolate synthase/folylpolyglutamate synthase